MSTTRLVCVGDSFTEGMSDVLRPDGHHVGWADRVAHALARQASASGDRVEYANLAVRGKLLDQVVDEQVPVAASFEPTITTFHAGPNDVLRRGTDLRDLFDRYDRAVRSVASASEQTVVFTSIGRAGGSGRVAQLLADRFARFNENVRAVAARHDAVLVDLEGVHCLDRPSPLAYRPSPPQRRGARPRRAAVLEQLGVQDPDLLNGPVGWWRRAAAAEAADDSSRRPVS